jgi:hypothetical protein
MQKEFEEASFALKPGEISPVIETASGLHLIERYVCLLRHSIAAFSVACAFHATRCRFHQSLAQHARSRVNDPLLVVLTRLFVFQTRVIAKADTLHVVHDNRADASLLTGHLPGGEDEERWQ